MKKYILKLHILISFVIMAVLVVVNTPTTVYGQVNDTVIKYIKNDYTNGAYLYEDDGILRYGIPLKGAKEFQWKINVLENGVTIENVATGNFITLRGQNTGGGNPLDPVKVLPFDNNDDTFLWEIDINEPEEQNILSLSSEYVGYVLHLEGITNGQVASERLSGNQLSWGNVNWKLYSESEINFDAVARDGFVIQNTKNGKYLLASGNELTFGIPTEPDNSFIWEFVQQENGTKYIVNKETKKYLNIATGTVGLSDNPEGLYFQIAIQTKIIDADDYHLIQDEDDIKAEKEVTDGFKWNIIPAAQVDNVVGDLILSDKLYNFKNAWFSMYLIEDNGQATYGNVNPENPYAQWRVVYNEENGLTALINVGSGHYLQTGTKENDLSLSDNESYTLKMLRNKNDLYPDAVVFYDTVNNTYIHMESKNGFIENSKAVQPNWGTPHWIPLVFDETTKGTEEEIYTPKEEFVRIKSAYKSNLYLYQTAAGGIGYGEISESDPRSHWKFVKSDVENVYILKNREYETYVTNLGNGVLRGFKPEQASGDGMLWQITTDGDNYFIKNMYSDMQVYHLPYLNISSLNGVVSSTLVSVEEKTTKWIFETAPEKVDGVIDESIKKVLLNTFTDKNRYDVIQDGKALDGNYQLEYYGTYVRVNKEGTDKYLINQDGNLKAIRFTNSIDNKFFFELENGIYLVSGEDKFELRLINSDAVYEKDRAYIYQDNVYFTVYVPKTDTYNLSLTVKDENTFKVAVNGIDGDYITVNDGNESDIFTLVLNKGINTVKVTNANSVQSLKIYNTHNKAYRGASVNYLTYEAEDAETTGTILEKSRAYRDLTSEASNRSAVQLDRTTQYIRFTLKEDMNALTLRYSIPDSLDGLGQDATLNIYINNEKKTAINLTSRYSWAYGQYPWSNNPLDGNAHVFFDEASILFDEVYPKGTVIMFKKDVINYSSSYILDLIETEIVEQPLSQPENSISITNFGAKPNDDVDDTQAFNSALKAAATMDKELWIPAGTFDVDALIEIKDDNVVIRGAGMWHSKLNKATFMVRANNVQFYDFKMDGAINQRRDSLDKAAIETLSSDNVAGLIVQNLWVVHHKVGVWINHMDNVLITGNRIRNTYADGMNLHAGVINAMITQNDIRNTGDDAIGLWSERFNNTNVNIYHNTIAIPWLANGIAVYGGKDINIEDNIVKDTVYAGSGINISTNFMPAPFSGTINVARNTLLRTGSDNTNTTVGGLWFNTIVGYNNFAKVLVSDNLILDSTYQGISFEGGGIVKEVILQSNVISNSGTNGIEILQNAKGNLIGKNNINSQSILSDLSNNSEDLFKVTLITDKVIIESAWSPVELVMMISGMGALIVGNGYLLKYYFKLRRNV